MEKALMRRGEVMAFLGLSWWGMRKAIDSGILTPVYLGRNEGKGRNLKVVDVKRAYYRTVEVRKLAGV